MTKPVLQVIIGSTRPGRWRDKPAGIVSYGAVSGGTRATQMLKQVMLDELARYAGALRPLRQGSLRAT